MKPTRLQFSVVLLVLFLALSACTSSQEAVQEAEPDLEFASEQGHHAVIEEVIPQMPAVDQEEQIWLNEQLMAMGPTGLQALLGYLTPPGVGDDTYARYAVSGLTKHVSRGGAESDQQMFEDVLLAELNAGRSKRVAVFLLHQLELIGSERAIPTVRQLLEDDDLYKPASEVLIAIDTPSAVQALQQALAEAADPARQETFVKSLGDIEDASVTDDVIPFASVEEWSVRRAALYALARSGDPSATTTLKEAADTTRSVRQRDARAFYLLFAQRLSEKGHTTQSAEIARDVLAAEYPINLKHAALSTFIQSEGAQALETLVDIGTSPDRRLRLGALSLAGELAGDDVTEAFVSRLEEVDPAVRADIIAMLGSRGDTSVLPSLTSYMQDDDPRTRLAAVEAVATLNEEEALRTLMDALNRAEDSKEVRGIEAVLRQMPTDQLLLASAEALPSASDSAKVVLIRTLADRRATEHVATVLDERTSPEEAVRIEVYRALQQLSTPDDLSVLVGSLSDVQSDEERAAVQDAVVAVLHRIESPEDRDEAIGAILSSAPDAQKLLIFEVLPQVGGEMALEALVGSAENSDPMMREVAIDALAGWPDGRAMPALLAIAQNAETSEQRSKLLEQYVRLAGTSDGSRSEKLEQIREAVAMAQSPQEQAVIINSFTSIDTPLALRAVGEYLNDSEDAVRESANEVAAELLTGSFGPSSSSLSNVELLSAILEMQANPEIAQQFEKQLNEARRNVSPEQLQSSSRPVTSTSEALFNGENLDGWEPVGGSSGGWDVADSVLYTDGSGGGWLSTTEIYDNFILELEYRVPEGGNSGVFLRAPRAGNPAYQGMEIQVLDDYDDQYADLAAWQYTGSIYSVKAPSQRVSKPAGEWQKMKIVANGPLIQVALNDEKIVSTNLVDHMHLVDDHPGLKRRKGYIGLQNHSTRIEYRNIVIHEIDGARLQNVD